MIDVGAVGAVGVAEHAQRCGLKITAGFFLMGQCMLAYKILLERFVGIGSEERRFGQHLRLLREDVAENS